MALVDTLNSKIDELKKYSKEELERVNRLLIIIDNSLLALDDEKKLKDFDFNISISLVNSHSFGILDLSKCITDIKNALIAKYNFHQDFIVLSTDQLNAIKSFKERLGFLKEELENRKKELETSNIDSDTLDNLIDLRNLLEGKGRRKFYTYDMIEALFQIIDYDKLSYAEIKELIGEFKKAKNFEKSFQEEKADVNEVKKLYQEFLHNRFNEKLFDTYANEICSRINLANARSILEFFRNEGILNRFTFYALLQLTLYGRFEYIEEFYFEKVLPKKTEVKEIYYEEIMTCVWINEKSSNYRNNKKIRINDKKEKIGSLYSTISEVNDDDIWENIRLIMENSDLFSEKYELKLLDKLWVITKPTWLIKKNLELFRSFNIRDITFAALSQNDLEDKMHFAIELGLLNGPRSPLYQEMEKRIPRYKEFNLNAKKKKRANQSILNYFSRNTSEIGKQSYTEYIYWFYKMLNSGREEFYQSFFSEYVAGTRNQQSFYSEEDKMNLRNSAILEKIIDDNFVTNYYGALINNYDEYDDVIKEFTYQGKGETILPYYDKEILNDQIVSELEKNNIMDNEYVYMFDDIIISRYKVLRNLTILKKKYGYLNEDMVLTSVVRNSYIGNNAFEKIKSNLTKGSKSI